MNSNARIVRGGTLAVVFGLCVMVLSGCSATSGDAAAGQAGGMMGGAEGSASGAIVGAIAAPKNAAIDANPGQDGEGRVLVARVVAPADGWLVVRSTLPSGGILGSVPVHSGESAGVAVKLRSVDSNRVVVSLHVDRGKKGVLEYDPADPSRSFDRAVYVERKPLEREMMLTGYGVETQPHETSVWADDQPDATTSLRVRQARVTAPAWLVVNAVENGQIGRRVGLIGIEGESVELNVPLSQVPEGTEELVITLVADQGESGRCEYVDGSPFGSSDQPYTLAGVTVATRVRIK